MTVRECYQQGLKTLQAAGIEEAVGQCNCLFEAATDMSHAKRITHEKESLPTDVCKTFFAWITRRVAGEPLQYILGKWNFCGRDFHVGEGVLIPRPETESLFSLVNTAVQSKGFQVIYDLCAGTGCLGLSLALENPKCQVFLFEKYDAALSFLRKNQADLQVHNVTILQADILQPVPSKLPMPDCIVSNPPYIPAAEIETLQSEVLREPRTALDGGTDGLLFYQAIAKLWAPLVKSGGEIFLECGDGQGNLVKELFQAQSQQQNVCMDFNDIDRFVQITV